MTIILPEISPLSFVVHTNRSENNIDAAIKLTFGSACSNFAFWEYLDELLAQMDAVIPRQRLRSLAAKQSIKQALTDLLLSLYKAHQCYYGIVGINLNKNFYDGYIPERYRRFTPSYYNLRYIYDGLQKLDLIRVVRKGFYVAARINDGRSTRISGTDKLWNELDALEVSASDISHAEESETIILRKNIKTKRGMQKLAVDYTDNRKTCRMRQQLKQINHTLSSQFVGTELTDREFTEMQRELCNTGKNYEVIDLGQKYLRRIFSEDFKHGGRFYGGWWQQIGSKWRRYIKINGNRTVEMDFSRLHPTLIYKKANIPMPDDPYAITPDTDAVKHIFNALLNAKDRRIQKIDRYSHSEWRLLVEAVIEAHAPVRKYFYKGYGLKLQYLDAQMAAYILLACSAAGIVAIPIHDSFIVEEQHTDKLKQLMNEASLKFSGAEIGIKIKHGYANRQSIADITNSTRITQKGGVHGFSGYNVRLNSWLNNQRQQEANTIH